MRPLTVLTAIIFGSAAAISFGLTATVIVFSILSGEQPQLQHEFPTLLRGCAVFLLLAGIAGASLYSLIKELQWRMYAHAAMWAAVAGVALLYWPK